MAQTPLHSLFHLPLSQQAHGQMLQLQNILEGVSLNESTDRWLYIWNTDQFSLKRAYNHLSGHLILHLVYNWLWRSSCQNKHKVFFWLLIKEDWVLGNYWEERIWISETTTAFFAMVQLKDHSYTFFLAVLLPHNAGLGLIFRLITTLILFRTFRDSKSNCGCRSSWRSSY
jgi:hypothetical protein